MIYAVVGLVGASSLALLFQATVMLACAIRQRRQNRRRQVLLLAGRLRVELLSELGSLEKRQDALRRTIEGRLAADAHEGLATLCQADFIYGLHRGLVGALRSKVEQAYEGLGQRRGHELGERLRTFAEIVQQVDALATELASREAAWQPRVVIRRPVSGKPASTRPVPRRLSMEMTVAA